MIRHERHDAPDPAARTYKASSSHPMIWASALGLDMIASSRLGMACGTTIAPVTRTPTISATVALAMGSQFRHDLVSDFVLSSARCRMLTPFGWLSGPLAQIEGPLGAFGGP